MATGNLTEYEQKRLQNIRRNEEIMNTLKIHSKATELSSSTKRQSNFGSKSFKVSPGKKPKTQCPVVIRRSLRNQGIPPDGEGLDDGFVEPSPGTSKPKSPDDSSFHCIGPVSMKNVYSGEGSDKALIDLFVDLAKGKELQNGGCNKGLEKDFGDGECKSEFVDFTEKVEKSNLDIGSLVLKPKNVARVVPGRILVVRFFPCEDKKIIAVGNKFGNLGFWNVDNELEEEDAIFLYQPHIAPISEISFQQSNLAKIYTSSYDGFIRLMDAEKEVFDLIYFSDDSIFSLSRPSNEANSLYFGKGSGELSVWDARTGKLSFEWDLHKARINSIDFNSQNPNLMATSSTDGTACLWDARSLNAHNPTSVKVVHHKKAVHSAYFSPSGKSLATTSIDNSVGIQGGNNFDNTCSIYHYNWTGRWLSNFRAIWGWDDSHIYIGNMKRGVDVISSGERRIVTTLQGPLMTAIPCRFDAHPFQVGTLAGATSGGQVYIWTPV